MAFIVDAKELKKGLIIFRRGDLQTRTWYCRVRVTKDDKYKVSSLKTTDVETATERAFDKDAELRILIKHQVPIFNRPFSQVAQEFIDWQTKRAGAKQITDGRVRNLKNIISSALNPYVGTVQITHVNADHWKEYPIWRHNNVKKASRAKGTKDDTKTSEQIKPSISDATIKAEMKTFRQILTYAAEKNYIKENQIPRDRIPTATVRREDFTPDEYRKLHTFARTWLTKGRSDMHLWYRTIVYNFVLIMCNTGMRPPEARNLCWRDLSVRTDEQGRKFVVLNVRGKGKHRSLVAAGNVAEYFERIRKIAKVTGPDDPIFHNWDGSSPDGLYAKPIVTLLKDAGLLISSSGKRRSTYSFRHTYATFRLSERVDVYFLAKQMGTSVKMIEEHYGHVNPIKNAELILQGMPGWESVSIASAVAAPAAAATRRTPHHHEDGSDPAPEPPAAAPRRSRTPAKGRAAPKHPRRRS